MSLKSDNYIVYRHTSPSGKVYIGITSRKPNHRWRNGGHGYKSSPKFYNAILKYGWDNIKHEIVLSDISKSEACYAEKYLVKWYKLHNISYNLSDGGEGVTGCSHAAWNRGMPCAEETKKKIGNANRGSNSPWWGKALSKEMKKKISESKRGVATKVCKVIQLTLSEEYVREWNSQSEAARALNLDSSKISKCCRGKRNKCGNYKWRYKNENKNN